MGKKKKKKWPWIVGIILVFVIIASLGNDDTDKEVADKAKEEEVTTDTTQANKELEKSVDESEEAAGEKESKKDDNFTMSQKNAIKQAESYLKYSAFSRQGLIDQLEYEGYSTEDATFAVDNITVDWNEQAAKQAESYLEYSSFSRQGLIEQLEYEGFTTEQATYGVTAVGY